MKMVPKVYGRSEGLSGKRAVTFVVYRGAIISNPSHQTAHLRKDACLLNIRTKIPRSSFSQLFILDSGKYMEI